MGKTQGWNYWEAWGEKFNKTPVALELWFLLWMYEKMSDELLKTHLVSYEKEVVKQGSMVCLFYVCCLGSRLRDCSCCRYNWPGFIRHYVLCFYTIPQAQYAEAQGIQCRRAHHSPLPHPSHIWPPFTKHDKHVDDPCHFLASYPWPFPSPSLPSSLVIPLSHTSCSVPPLSVSRTKFKQCTTGRQWKYYGSAKKALH